MRHTQRNRIRLLNLGLVVMGLVPLQERELGGFEERFRVEGIATLFDTGVVDLDADGDLDLYTVNHSRLQRVLVNLGESRFEDRYAALGLHQDAQHPGLEGEPEEAEVEPGTLCIYWLGKNLIVAARDLVGTDGYRGTLTFFGGVRVNEAGGFELETRSTPIGNDAERTELTFEPPASGILRLDPRNVSSPIVLRFESESDARRVRVGRAAELSSEREIEFALRDRHGHAWSDTNDDGRIDLFIARGGLGGTAARFPVELRDELLVRTDTGFEDASSTLRLSAGDDRARRTQWIDADLDGRLDLMITSHQAPLQLLLRRPEGFVPVAEAWGIASVDVAEARLADLRGDRHPELVVAGPGAITLFARDGERYEPLERVALTGDPTSALLADDDGDGDRDILVTTSEALVLLRNEGDRFELVRARTLGLPRTAEAAEWVDVDNDGDLDLFAFPGGLYEQKASSRFQKRPDFVLGTRAKSRGLWADLDGDGTRDLVFSTRTPRTRTWQIEVYANLARSNNWLQVDLTGPAGNREAVGASVRATTPSGEQVRWVGEAEGSLYCQGHYRVYLGLGSASGPVDLLVTWPDGTEQTIEDVAPNQRLELAHPAVEPR